MGPRIARRGASTPSPKLTSSIGAYRSYAAVPLPDQNAEAEASKFSRVAIPVLQDQAVVRSVNTAANKLGFARTQSFLRIWELATTLIVLAHPDRRSFNGAWAEATGEACKNLGHTVLWSDLKKMEFNPVESACRYPHYSADDVFDPLKAQKDAADADSFPEDVFAEIEKLRRADQMILHFPLWWFAPPAILKGWFDRVLAHGALHSVDERFDNGVCLGKKALFCVTTGSSEAESAFNGREGDVQMLLWPAAYTLRYLGYTVLVPEVVHGVHGFHEETKRNELQDRLRAVLSTQTDRMKDFDQRPILNFNADSDFDSDGVLNSNSPSHSLFIRQAP